MAYEKGEKVETGIWKVKASKQGQRNQYLVEVNYCDPETWQRVRKRKTFNRLDMATSWRRKMLDDEKRGELLKDQSSNHQTFAAFTIEYLQHWGRERKDSTLARETSRIKSILNPVFGKRALCAIGRKDIEVFLTRRKDQGASPASEPTSLGCRIRV